MITQQIEEFAKRHSVAVEKLTEQQLADALRQAIASGDFMRHVTHEGAQAVTYVPFRELHRFKALYYELLYAVETVHEGETRHETALRYIREREQRLEPPSKEA